MFRVKYCDYYREEKLKSVINRPKGSGDWLFLIFHKPMHLETEEEKVTTDENACLLFSPTDKHKFMGAPDFLNSYIHFIDSDGEIGRRHIRCGTVFYTDNFERIDRLVRDITVEKNAGSSMSVEMTDCLMRQLMILIRRAEDANNGDGMREIFENIRFSLLSHCEKNINVTDKAAELCMNKTKFYELYKKYFGIAPKKDILNARMEKASVLLTSENVTVKEAAEAVGFANVEHFCRYFKQHYGYTPKKRKKHQ